MKYRLVCVSVLVIFCFGNTVLEAFITSDGCGTEKSCYREPAGCTGTTDCEVLVSWMTKGTSTVFEILGRMNAVTGDEHYVGIGFSHDQIMPDTDVWACLLQTDDITVAQDHSYNDGYNNNQLTVTGTSNYLYQYANGVIECTFHRENEVEGDPFFFSLIDNEYYLLIPRGPRLLGPGFTKLGKHIALPIISATKYNFTSNEFVGGLAVEAGAESNHGVFWLSSVLSVVVLLFNAY